jgi:transcriptional regulator with XRE-family HTH domain
MSSSAEDPRAIAAKRAEQLVVVLGGQLRDERTRRHLTVTELAERAHVSKAAASAAENGDRASLDMLAALAGALGLSLEMDLVDRRQKDRMLGALKAEDPVHAAMGELEAARLRGLRHPVGMDVPYQHYQFSGRADVVAWSVEHRALLHLENRTRFPNYQEAIGSFGAKRAYLASEFAKRNGLRPFASETHVMVCLWSSEMLHALRLRAETFRSVCGDPADDFSAWWSGSPPPKGKTSSLVVLDPLATGRERRWIDLESALTSARPRIDGYASAASLLEARARARAKATSAAE